MAMTLSQMVTEAVTRSGRPEKQALLQSYILEVTLQLHCANNWNYDRASFDHTFVTPAARVTFPFSTITNFRALDGIKRLADDDLSVEYEPALALASAATLTDEFGQQRTECYFLNGAGVTLLGVANFKNIRVYHYKLPLLGTTDGTYSSWIADKYPYIIVNMAVQLLHKRTGNREIANDMNADVAADFRTLQTIDLTAIH